MAETRKEHELIETPAEALGPSVLDAIDVGTRTFLVERPDAVDRLSDHPVLGGASATEEYKPFWASLWPAARLLADAVLAEPFPATHTRALEIGCGLGLPGLAALARGMHVTFSDYDATALRYAARNARLNAFHDFEVLHMDWRQPPPGLRVPLLLASEPIYAFDLVESLADFIERVLEPDGLFLLTDQERMQAEALRKCLEKRGMTCEWERRQIAVKGEAGVEGILTRIRHNNL
jgi:SAM-dependent methyltransferase